MDSFDLNLSIPPASEDTCVQADSADWREAQMCSRMDPSPPKGGSPKGKEGLLSFL
jgi:hypothetical protein